MPVYGLPLVSGLTFASRLPLGTWIQGSDQHTLSNDMVEKICFGREGVVLEEGGPHFAMMVFRMVFDMIVG